MICLHWIRKLKARYLSGDYAEALAAADKATGAASGVRAYSCMLLDYFYYTALTVAALYEKLLLTSRPSWRELLAAHREQLREWAENLSTDLRRQARPGVGRDRAHRRPGRRSHASVRASHSIGSRARLRAERRRLAHEVAAGFYAARGARASRTTICATRAQLLSALGRARQGPATRATPSQARRGIAPSCAERDDRCTRRAAGRRDSGQGFAGGVERDRAGQAHRDAHERSRSSMRGPSGACSYFSRATSRGSRRRRRPAAATLR